MRPSIHNNLQAQLPEQAERVASRLHIIAACLLVRLELVFGQHLSIVRASLFASIPALTSAIHSTRTHHLD